MPAVSSFIRHRLLTMLCLVLLTSGINASAAFRIRSVRVRGITHLFLTDVARYYGMQTRTYRDNIVLHSQYSELKFEINRREAVLNGVRVHLSYAPHLWRSEALISESDFRLLLDPILRRHVLGGRDVKTIVIDPGHGGRDPGAAGARYAEKELTLGVAREVAGFLRRHGYRVYLTRTGDTSVSLTERAAAARRMQADLFVSIHANATGKSWVRGIETFFLTPEGTPSTYSTQPKREASPGNAFDLENARLAYEIQKYLTAGAGTPDRGIKHANFAVLREAGCPSALVEMGFITNREDEQMMASAKIQRRLARNIAYGIISFHNALRKNQLLAAETRSR